MQTNFFKIAVTAFAIIGLLAVIGVLGMWFMHGSMMGMMQGGGMPAKMAAMCHTMMSSLR